MTPTGGQAPRFGSIRSPASRVAARAQQAATPPRSVMNSRRLINIRDLITGKKGSRPSGIVVSDYHGRKCRSVTYFTYEEQKKSRATSRALPSKLHVHGR